MFINAREHLWLHLWRKLQKDHKTKSQQYSVRFYVPVNNYGQFTKPHSFSWASLTKLLTSTRYSYFRL